MSDLDAPCERCIKSSRAAPAGTASSLTPPAVIYCTSCDALLCQTCEQSLHTPSNSTNSASHIRVPASHSAAYRLVCAEQHPSSPASSTHRITHYCRTCARAVCQSCIDVGGAHHSTDKSSSSHSVHLLTQEFAFQLSELRRSVGSEAMLESKRLQFLNELQSMDNAAVSLAGLVAAIESQEKSSAQQTLHRLNNVHQMNHMRVQNSMERIKNDIAEIDAFLTMTGLTIPPASTVSTLAPNSTSSNAAASPSTSTMPAAASSTLVPISKATPATMSRFIASMRTWISRAQALSTANTSIAAMSTAATTTFEAPPLPPLESLPSEVRDSAAKEQQFQQLLALLRVKDELLRFAMAARKGLVDEQASHARNLQRLYESSQKEMEQWMELSEKLTAEVRAFKQRCAFCHTALNGVSASQPCAANLINPAVMRSNPLIAESGSERREGDGLHYFVPA